MVYQTKIIKDDIKCLQKKKKKKKQMNKNKKGWINLSIEWIKVRLNNASAIDIDIAGTCSITAAIHIKFNSGDLRYLNKSLRPKQHWIQMETGIMDRCIDRWMDGWMDSPAFSIQLWYRWRYVGNGLYFIFIIAVLHFR